VALELWRSRVSHEDVCTIQKKIGFGAVSMLVCVEGFKVQRVYLQARSAEGKGKERQQPHETGDERQSLGRNSL